MIVHPLAILWVEVLIVAVSLPCPPRRRYSRTVRTAKWVIRTVWESERDLAGRNALCCAIASCTSISDSNNHCVRCLDIATSHQ